MPEGTCECDLTKFQMSDKEFECLLKEIDAWALTAFKK